MEQKELTLTCDLPSHLKREAAEVIYDAFKYKMNRLNVHPKSKNQAVRLFVGCFHFEHGLYCLLDGHVLGVLGLQYRGKKLLDFSFKALSREFGMIGALGWEIQGILKSFEKLNENTLVIDALAVAEQMRGRGVGTALLEYCFKFAAENNLSTIELDIINHNEGAMRLYERMGFKTYRERNQGAISRIFGFNVTSHMRKIID